MDKKYALKLVKHAVFFLLAAVIIIFAHYSNQQYKERHGIDATTGATEMAD